MAVSGVNIAAYLHCTCMYYAHTIFVQFFSTYNVSLAEIKDRKETIFIMIRGANSKSNFCGLGHSGSEPSITVHNTSVVSLIIQYVCNVLAIHELISYSCLLNSIQKQKHFYSYPGEI